MSAEVAALDPAALPAPIAMHEITVPDTITCSAPLTYTDCVESSLLRYIQAVVIDVTDPSRVSLPRLRELGCEGIWLDFFTRHDRVWGPEWFVTAAGLAMRNEWAIMVTRLPDPDDLLYFTAAEGQEQCRFELNATLHVLLVVLQHVRGYVSVDMRVYVRECVSACVRV